METNIEKRLQERIIKLLNTTPEKFQMLVQLEMEKNALSNYLEAVESLVLELLQTSEDGQLDYLWFTFKNQSAKRAA